MRYLTISPKGSVVIPAELRRKYGLSPGGRVRIVDYGGVLSIVPEYADPVAAAAGMLHSGKPLTNALPAEHGIESELDR